MNKIKEKINEITELNREIEDYLSKNEEVKNFAIYFKDNLSKKKYKSVLDYKGPEYNILLATFIENYEELKEFLIEKGFFVRSTTTDSEINSILFKILCNFDYALKHRSLFDLFIKDNDLIGKSFTFLYDFDFKNNKQFQKFLEIYKEGIKVGTLQKEFFLSHM